MNHLLRRPGFVIGIIFAMFITGYLVSRRPVQFSRIPSPAPVSVISTPRPILSRPTPVDYADYEPPPFPGLDAEEIATIEGKVAKLPEVQEFLKLVGGRGIVTYDHIDEQDNSYVFHVYEDLPDHTATFNWYSVSKSTGKITKQFNP